MKRLLIFLVVFLPFLRGEAQTTTTSDRVVTKSLYLRDWWVDSVKRDTNFLGAARSIPTAAAVYNFVAGRGAPGYTSVTSLPDSSGLVFHGPNGVKDTVVFEGETGGGGSSLPSMTGNAGKVLTTDGTNPQWTGTAKYAFTNLQDGQLIKAQISGGDTTFVNFTPNYATQSALQDSASALRSAIGAGGGASSGTLDSLRVLSATPATGNVWIDSATGRTKIRDWVHNKIFTVAYADSTTFTGGGGGSTLLSGLVAYYTLDGSGADASPNGLTMTTSGSPTYVTGHMTQAVKLTRVSSQYLTRAHNAADDYSAGFTLAFWMKADAGSIANAVVSLLVCKSDATNGAFGVYTQGAGGGGQAYINGFSYRADGTTQDQVTWNITPLINDQYHFVVLKWNGSQLSMKVDNAAAQSVAKPSIMTSTHAVRIGSDERNNLYFDGWIDGVGIWNRATTDAEDTELYNAGAGRQYAFN